MFKQTIRFAIAFLALANLVSVSALMLPSVPAPGVPMAGNATTSTTSTFSMTVMETTSTTTTSTTSTITTAPSVGARQVHNADYVANSAAAPSQPGADAEASEATTTSTKTPVTHTEESAPASKPTVHDERKIKRVSLVALKGGDVKDGLSPSSEEGEDDDLA